MSQPDAAVLACWPAYGSAGKTRASSNLAQRISRDRRSAAGFCNRISMLRMGLRACRRGGSRSGRVAPAGQVERLAARPGSGRSLAPSGASRTRARTSPSRNRAAGQPHRPCFLIRVAGEEPPLTSGACPRAARSAPPRRSPPCRPADRAAALRLRQRLDVHSGGVSRRRSSNCVSRAFSCSSVICRTLTSASSWSLSP
jgi:hypothetical protein